LVNVPVKQTLHPYHPYPQFIGELFIQKMLAAKIMHECIIKLLGDVENPDEEDIECLCKLLATIGARLDSDPKQKEFIDKYMVHLNFLANSTKLDNRHRFMIRDTMEMRANGWTARVEKMKAGKLEDVKKNREKEEIAKAQRASRPLPSESGGRRNNHSRGNARGGPQGQRNVMSQVTFTNNMSNSIGGGKGGYQLGGNKARSGAGSQDVRNQGSAPRRQSGAAPSGGSMRPGGGGSMRPGGMRPGGPGGAPMMAGGPRGLPRAGGAGAPSAAAAAPAAKVASIDASKMKTLVENLVSEYVDIRSMEEVLAHLSSTDEKFVDVTKVRTTLIDVCLTSVMEKKDREREAIPTLLVELFNAKRLTQAHVTAPLKSVLEFMPDIKVDVPLAEKHLASLLAHLFHNTTLSVAMLPEVLSLLAQAEPTSVVGVVKSFLSALVAVDAAKAAELYKAAKPDFSGVIAAGDKEKLDALLGELKLDA
jgi:translation initiation factor 4G